MPLFLHEDLEFGGELGLWQIDESENWFLSKVGLNEAEQAQFDQINGRKRIEWLSVRYLVHLMSGREKRGSFLKDEHGKPHLEASPFQISISHSHDFSAAIAAPKSVGIDIQFLVAKIERLAHKYMRSVEIESLEDESKVEHLHVYWGAKEALYKAYGRRQLDFCSHILIDPFPYNSEGGTFTGQVIKEGFGARYKLWYRLIGKYMLVYAVEV